MKIGQKLIGSFAIVAAICGIVGGVGWYGIGQLDTSLNEIGGQSLPAVQALMTMDAVMGDCATAQMELLYPFLSKEEAEGMHSGIAEAIAEIGSAGDDFEKVVVHEEDKLAFTEIRGVFAEFTEAAHEFVGLSEELNETGRRDPSGFLYELARIENAHREWLFWLNETVVEGEEFTKQLDPTKCVLGKWIVNVDVENQVIQDSIAVLSEVHAGLHQSAEQIMNIFAKSKGALAKAAAMDIYDNTSIPALGKVVHYLEEVFGNEARRSKDLVLAMINVSQL